ncbi:MAG TPA: O-antigen ligase family protein [Candidatus Polarisedimenticolaceae bacterium]
MPRWFYWVCALAMAVAWLLPYPPVKFAIFAMFGLIFVSFYRTAPERTLFVFLLGMPVLDLIPATMFPLPGLNAETIVIGALFAAGVTSQRQQEQPAPENPFTLPVAYYAIVMAVSGVRSYLSGVGEAAELLASVKNQIFFVFLAPIAFRLIHTEKHLRTALNLIALTCTLVSLHALWLTRDTLLRGLMLERNRAVGLVAGQSNLFGGFLAMMILIFVAVLLGRDLKFRVRLGYMALVAAMGGALLMTLSRGSWLALLLGLSALALLRGARAVAFVLAVALTAPLWLPEKVVERVQHTFQGRQSTDDQLLEDSAQVRLDQWKALPTIVAEAPIFGHGFQSFRHRWARYAADGEPKAAHSMWVEFLAEEGLVGIAAYLWLLGLLGFTALRVWLGRDGGLVRDVALGLMCAILCLALLDTSGTRFRNREVMAYIWVLGGALARFAVERRRKRGDAGTSTAGPTQPDRRRKPTWTRPRRPPDGLQKCSSYISIVASGKS